MKLNVEEVDWVTKCVDNPRYRIMVGDPEVYIIDVESKNPNSDVVFTFKDSSKRLMTKLFIIFGCDADMI